MYFVTQFFLVVGSIFTALFSRLKTRTMIFKYRGTTIRLFSRKLFILVTLGIGAVLAVFTLREMITFDASYSRDSTPSSNGFYSNQPQNNPYFLGTVANSNEGDTKTVGKEENKLANNNIPQESLRIHEIRRPTITISLNKTVSPEVQKLRDIVRAVNKAEYIRNGDKFGTTLSQKSIVIIVQVHDRGDYFSYLLKSLSRAKGIEDALLVISHDYYSEEINRHVESIDFCKVIQIFFPFADQLFPDQFPGTDPNDCPRDISRENFLCDNVKNYFRTLAIKFIFASLRAREIGCNNAATPDMFGHYRQAKFTMIKHHWWWKANTVFDMLNATKTYMGPVLFLEEDYYVSPDFYHMLRLLYDGKMRGCKDDCDLVTLGSYKTVDNYELNGAKDTAQLSVWRSHEHNMGMAFDRTTWNKIKECSEVFCKSYDEYNWDWSLMKISASCLSNPFKSLVLKGSRVYHLGECGLHHKKKDCNVEATVQKFQTVIDKNTNSFYPPSVNIEPGDSTLITKFGPNGGWGDSRDHALCFQLMQKR